MPQCWGLFVVWVDGYNDVALLARLDTHGSVILSSAAKPGSLSRGERDRVKASPLPPARYGLACCLLVSLSHEVPVDHMIEFGNVISPTKLVFEVVGVFPEVDTQQRRSAGG